MAIDFILGFLLLIGFVALFMNDISFMGNRDKERTDFRDMAITANNLLDTLLQTPGDPPQWDSNNVKSIGLASNDRTLSQKKTEQFINLEYSTVKQLWKIPFDFRFVMRQGNETI